MPFPTEDGQTPYFTILKDGQKSKEGSGNHNITTACPYYNYNPTVGQL